MIRFLWAFGVSLLAIPLAGSIPSFAQGYLEPLSLVRLTADGHFKQRPAWSPDGKWLAFARHQGAKIELYLRAGDGSMEKRLTDGADPEFDAVFSPDGKRLAFALDKASPNQGDMEVYTIGLDGKDLKPVATGQGKLSHEESPAWSPDGKWIAWTSTRDGNQELYYSAPDGSNVKRVTSDPGIDAHPSWSPDSKKIAFATERWGDLEIAVYNLEGETLTRLTASDGLDDYPAWSPDGKQIAFTSNRDRNLEIYTMSADGGDIWNLTQDPSIDNFPSWHPDGRLTLVSNRGGGFDIYLSETPVGTEPE